MPFLSRWLEIESLLREFSGLCWLGNGGFEFILKGRFLDCIF